MKRLPFSIPCHPLSGTSRALSGESFPHLRLLCIGGEPVYANDVEIYKKHFADECILVGRLGCGEAGKVSHYMIDKRQKFKTTMCLWVMHMRICKSLYSMMTENQPKQARSGRSPSEAAFFHRATGACA